jgi:DNA-binding helix-hairpin-helix protein with protein kinase domain
MTLRYLYDNRNQRVELGNRLGEGGEGEVFEVVGQPSAVAKVYRKPPDARQEQKLKAMATLAQADLLKVAAWPTATLHQNPQGSLLGILMPRVSGYKEVHTLYSPAHRKKEFPTADWSFLIQVAMNCAIAVEAIHRGGHAIGDVNQSNILVSPKAMVRLIDCDSFQINAGGRCFPCEVGVPLYTPPELQGQSFRGVVRTPNHDRFGLAVLIFHLLFVGRHPFSGRPLTSGDLPIDKAIKEYRFAYSRAAAQLQIAPPLHTPALSILPAEVARLFERAFSTHSAGPTARPTAQEWAANLSAMQKQLKACTADAGHKFPTHLGQCCWCALMKAGAPNYFVSVAVYGLGASVPSLTFVLGPMWAEIDRVPRPQAAYLRPSVPSSARIAPTALPLHIPSRPPPRVEIPRDILHKYAGWTAVGCACVFPVIILIVTAAGFKPFGIILFAVASTVGFGIWWFVLEMMHRSAVQIRNAERDAIVADMRREKDQRHQAYQGIRQELEAAENEWSRTARHYEQSFTEQKHKLEQLKNDYSGLKAKYDQEYRELERNKEVAQRNQFLQSQFISDHNITGIGPVREAVLRSNGIETAYDVSEQRLLEINGFGPVLTGNLLAWKQQVSRQFRFNATAAVSPSELSVVVVKYRQLQQRLEGQVQAGLSDLRSCAEKSRHHLAQVYVRIPELVVRLTQATLDIQVLPSDKP